RFTFSTKGSTPEESQSCLAAVIQGPRSRASCLVAIPQHIAHNVGLSDPTRPLRSDPRMRNSSYVAVSAAPFFAPTFALCIAIPSNAADQPISLHPENPHYLLFRGKPTVLVTSGEHYGAVLNLDFDYLKYLDELKSCGLNLTRTFSGTYHELPSSFG